MTEGPKELFNIYFFWIFSHLNLSGSESIANLYLLGITFVVIWTIFTRIQGLSECPWSQNELQNIPCRGLNWLFSQSMVLRIDFTATLAFWPVACRVTEKLLTAVVAVSSPGLQALLCSTSTISPALHSERDTSCNAAQSNEQMELWHRKHYRHQQHKIITGQGYQSIVCKIGWMLCSVHELTKLWGGFGVWEIL